MKRSTVRTFCLVAALLLGMAVVVAPAGARTPAQAQRQAAGMCSAATVAGQWAYSATGTAMSKTGPVPGAHVGEMTVDARGNIGAGTHATNSGGIGGMLTPRGTVTVNPDCTGTMVRRMLDPKTGALLRTVSWSVVWYDNGNEYRAIMTSLKLPDGTLVPSILTETGHKVFQAAGTCSLAAESGQWAYTATGTLMGKTGPVPFAVVGGNTWDAQGNIVAGLQTTSAGGVIAVNTPRGTVSVNADCTGTITVRLLDPKTGALQRTATWFTVNYDNGNAMLAIMTSLKLPTGTSVPPIVTMDAVKLYPNGGTAQ